jgi:hypothetical protein
MASSPPSTEVSSSIDSSSIDIESFVIAPWSCGSLVRPGARPGSQMTAKAAPRAATPTAREKWTPQRQTFSAAMTAASAIIAGTFITPSAIRITISPQQQAAHTKPCSEPARRSREAPRKDAYRSRCPIGERQWERHRFLSGVSW